MRADEPEAEVELAPAVDGGAPAARAALAPVARRAGARVLEGTVVVKDELGGEHRGEGGSFMLMVWSGNKARGYSVNVRAGAWSAEVSPAEGGGAPDALSVLQLYLGGVEAIGDDGPKERLPFPSDGKLELHAHWEHGLILRLHVRDQDTGRELAPVFLARATRSSAEELEHPGIPAGEDDLGASPVKLGLPGAEIRIAYVRSPGYAWRRIDLGDGPNERVVALEPGGDLRVLVDGPLRTSGMRLRLFPKVGPGRETALAEFDLGNEKELVVRGIPAGALDVRAYTGERSMLHQIGSWPAEIVAGSMATVTLKLEAHDDSLVPFEGTLLLSPAWESGDFQLFLSLMGDQSGGWHGVAVKREEMELVDAARGLFHWSAQVQPGVYLVSLLDFYAMKVDVDLHGKRDCRIEVPPPCRIRVRCIDDASGEDVDVAQLNWRFLTQGGLAFPSKPAATDPSAHRCEFRAPQGEVEIDASGAETERLLIQAGPGINEAELHIQTTGLYPILMDGGTRIPWDKDRLPSLEPAAGQQGSTRVFWSGDLLTLGCDQPGLYWLKTPQLFDYEPIADRQVELEAGSIKPLVIELQRKP